MYTTAEPSFTNGLVNPQSAASWGTIARRYPHNYEMGLGLDQLEVGYPGVTATESTTEGNARAFYTRWAQLMDAQSWDQTAPKGKKRRPSGAANEVNGRKSVQSG